MENTGQSTSPAFGLRDGGRVRNKNHDQFPIAELSKSMLVSFTTLDMGERVFGHVQGESFLVGNGLGGRAAGEQASGHFNPPCNEKILDPDWTPKYGFLNKNSTANTGYQALDE